MHKSINKDNNTHLNTAENYKTKTHKRRSKEEKHKSMQQKTEKRKNTKRNEKTRTTSTKEQIPQQRGQTKANKKQTTVSILDTQKKQDRKRTAIPTPLQRATGNMTAPSSLTNNKTTNEKQDTHRKKHKGSTQMYSDIIIKKLCTSCLLINKLTVTVTVTVRVLAICFSLTADPVSKFKLRECFSTSTL